jgi:hypothetical protein
MNSGKCFVIKMPNKISVQIRCINVISNLNVERVDSLVIIFQFHHTVMLYWTMTMYIFFLPTSTRDVYYLVTCYSTYVQLSGHNNMGYKRKIWKRNYDLLSKFARFKNGPKDLSWLRFFVILFSPSIPSTSQPINYSLIIHSTLHRLAYCSLLTY